MRKITIEVLFNDLDFCWYGDAFINGKYLIGSWGKNQVQAHKSIIKRVKKYYKKELENGTLTFANPVYNDVHWNLVEKKIKRVAINAARLYSSPLKKYMYFRSVRKARQKLLASTK